jgi:hypothetical protein
MDTKLEKLILELIKVHDQRGDEIAKALNRIAVQLMALGNGNAADNGVGAIEGLAMQIRDGLGTLSSSIGEVSNSIDTK